MDGQTVEMPQDVCSPLSPPRLTPAGVVGSHSPTSVAERHTVELAPSRSFDPPPEEALRHAIALATTKRKRHTREHFTIRYRAHEGRLLYLLEAEPDLLTLLLHRLPENITVREPPPSPPLALLSSATYSLVLPRVPRAVPTDPDPLGDFARVLSTVAPDEYGEIVLDLAPAAKPEPAKLPWHHRVRVPKLDLPAAASAALRHLNTDPLARPVPSPVLSVPAPAVVPSPPPAGEVWFRIAVSAHAFADQPQRARELARSLLSPFHAWEPSGSLRALYRGPSAPENLGGSRPRGHLSRVVQEAAIRGLLLPPTARCAATNVRRTAASAAVPDGLVPLGPGVFPIGTPLGYSEPRGIPSRDMLFAMSLGRSGFGKSSQAMTEFCALTLPRDEAPDTYDGGVFIDPHRDAIQALGGYYWRCPERVLRIDLGRPWESSRLPVYNPIDAWGCSDEEAERRVSAVVSGFLAATGWNAQRATRALPLITESTRLLVAVARGLPDRSVVPSLFCIPRVLTDDSWRADILHDDRIAPAMRSWWSNEFPRLPKDAPLAVTLLISRLRASTPIAALLGGRSTFSWREVMDGRLVVLYAGLLSGDDKDRLATSLILRAPMLAAYSRSDVPEEERDARCPLSWIYIDETPMVDGPDLAAYFQQVRKFRVRAKIMAQSPSKLRKDTWEAAVTNSSLIQSTAVDGEGASMVARLWRGPGAADMPEIEQFHHLVSATIQGKRSEAFLVEGMQPGDHFDTRPEVLENWILRDPRYRDIEEAAAELEDLDERLREAWTGGKRSGGTVSVSS